MNPLLLLLIAELKFLEDFNNGYFFYKPPEINGLFVVEIDYLSAFELWKFVELC
jgi:hypothetical protein